MPEGLLGKFSTALVAALATTLVAVLAEWLRQRGDGARAKRDTEQALSRINFLSAWLELQEQLSASDAESARIVIAQELEDIRRQAEQAWARAKRARRPAARQALRRLVMLGVGKSVYTESCERSIGSHWLGSSSSSSHRSSSTSHMKFLLRRISPLRIGFGGEPMQCSTPF
jgi:hypothetical protein